MFLSRYNIDVRTKNWKLAIQICIIVTLYIYLLFIYRSENQKKWKHKVFENIFIISKIIFLIEKTILCKDCLLLTNDH